VLLPFAATSAAATSILTARPPAHALHSAGPKESLRVGRVDGVIHLSADARDRRRAIRSHFLPRES